MSPPAECPPGGTSMRVMLVAAAPALWWPDSGIAQAIRELDGPTQPGVPPAFARNGTTLATADGSNTVRLWSFADSGRCRAIHEHGSPITALAVGPDGNAVAVGDRDGGLEIWGPFDESFRRLADHRGGVASLAFDSDGRTLFSA